MHCPCLSFDLCAEETGWEDPSVRISAVDFRLGSTPRLVHRPAPLLRHGEPEGRLRTHAWQE